MVFAAGSPCRKLTGKQLKHSETESAPPLRSETFRNIALKNVKVSVTTRLSRGLRNRGRLDQPPKNKLDLTRLRARMGGETTDESRSNPAGVAGYQSAVRCRTQPQRHLDVAERNRNRDRLCAVVPLYGPAKTPRSNRRARCDVASGSGSPRSSPTSRYRRRLRRRREKPEQSPTSHRPNDPLANIREREDRRLGLSVQLRTRR